MKIGSGATVKLFQMCLKDGPAPPLDLFHMHISPWYQFSIKKPRIVPQPCDGSMAIQVFHHRPNHNSRESLFSTRPMAGIHGHMGHRMDMSGPDRAEATLVSSQA